MSHLLLCDLEGLELHEKAARSAAIYAFADWLSHYKNFFYEIPLNLAWSEGLELEFGLVAYTTHKSVEFRG